MRCSWPFIVRFGREGRFYVQSLSNRQKFVWLPWTVMVIPDKQYQIYSVFGIIPDSLVYFVWLPWVVMVIPDKQYQILKTNFGFRYDTRFFGLFCLVTMGCHGDT